MPITFSSRVRNAINVLLNRNTQGVAFGDNVATALGALNQEFESGATLPYHHVPRRGNQGDYLVAVGPNPNGAWGKINNLYIDWDYWAYKENGKIRLSDLPSQVVLENELHQIGNQQIPANIARTNQIPTFKIASCEIARGGRGFDGPRQNVQSVRRVSRSQARVAFKPGYFTQRPNVVACKGQLHTRITISVGDVSSAGANIHYEGVSNGVDIMTAMVIATGP